MDMKLMSATGQIDRRSLMPLLGGGVAFLALAGKAQAQQVPLPKTAAEVPGPSLRHRDDEKNTSRWSAASPTFGAGRWSTIRTGAPLRPSAGARSPRRRSSRRADGIRRHAVRLYRIPQNVL